MSYTLHYSPGSVALASHLVLEEIGAPYEAVPVDFGAGQQQSPEFLALNPKGRVPVLIDDGHIITEGIAIMLHLANAHPEAGLLPPDSAPDHKWRITKLLSHMTYFATTVHINHGHKLRGARWADEESSYLDMRRKVPETMGNAFDLIENEQLEGPWLMGDQFTIGDCYLFTFTSWLDGDGVPATRHPRVREHFARMLERPAVAKVAALHGI